MWLSADAYMYHLAHVLSVESTSKGLCIVGDGMCDIMPLHSEN